MLRFPNPPRITEFFKMRRLANVFITFNLRNLCKIARLLFKHAKMCSLHACIVLHRSGCCYSHFSTELLVSFGNEFWGLLKAYSENCLCDSHQFTGGRFIRRSATFFPQFQWFLSRHCRNITGVADKVR